MASSDIIKIGFDYRSSLEQFEKDTNGVFDGISNKAGKQKITIQLDAKDDKIIDKIKELQKFKLDKFTFEFGNSGLEEQLQTFDKLENKINEIIDLSRNNLSSTFKEIKKAASLDGLSYGTDEYNDELKKVTSSIVEMGKKGQESTREYFIEVQKLLNLYELFRKTAENSGLFNKNTPQADKFSAFIRNSQLANDLEPIKDTTSDIFNGCLAVIDNFIDASTGRFISLKDSIEKVITISEGLKSINNADEITPSNPLSNDVKIEELKSDIVQVKVELTEVKEKISGIDAEGFENIKNDVEKTKESVKELNNELVDMKTNLSSTSTETNISSGMKDAFPDKDVSASVESATNSIKEENNVLEQNTQKVKENTQAKEQNANIDFSKYDKRLDSYNGKIDKYKTTIDRFKDGGWTSDTYLKNVQAVRDAVKQYATLLDDIKTNQNGIATDEDIQNLDKYEKKIKDTIATVTNMSASEKGYSQLAGQKEIDKINKILRENSAMSSEAKAKIKAYKQELISGNPSVSLEKIHGEIMKIVNAEELAGRAGRNFFDTLKNSGFHQLAAQMAGMFGFYDVINLGKEAISTIVSLDDALVDLKKTTAMNKTQLEDFYYDANDVAKQMGVTTEEIITQASAWSRLGYSSQEAATTMAKLSSKFASISPGMSTDEAQEGLVSIMKAFDIDPDDVETEIMDKVNVLGNKFAEENQDVIEGLKRSAAAMSAMGQSFTDTAALFTGGMEILQDSESMGTALRTLSMRVRGYDEETNQLSDDLVNVTGEVADLTKTAQDSQGVSLFTDATQEHYRSMVEYLGDIADRWDQISEKNQTELLQKLFGKNRANAGAAIIQNFDQVRAAIEAMDKSAGSSEAEMSAIESSLSYKINALKETWVGCVQDMVDRGDLGTIVTGLTKVSEAITFLLDKLGILGSIGLGAGIFSGIKNVGIGTLVAHQSNHCYCFDVPTS